MTRRGNERQLLACHNATMVRLCQVVARKPSLKPKFREGRISPWVVNVPSSLSESGKRREEFFSTKQEALARCERLKANRDNYGANLAGMTGARLAAAHEAYKLLGPIKGDLIEAVRFYLEAHRRRTASIPFVRLFTLYMEAKQNRSAHYRQELRITLNRMSEFHSRLASEITHQDLEPFLNSMTPGARNPVMRYLRAVFRFGIRRGFVAEDPISRLDFAYRPRKEVETIPVEQVRAMLNCALEIDLELLPFLVLATFCGIRPDGELPKLRWDDVKATEVVIRPDVSKTRRRRFVDLSPNAIAWLNAYAVRGGIMTGKVVRYNPPALHEHRRANRKAAGVIQWPQQGLRHTFCSNWLSVFKDVNKLVLMSGHDSVDTLWRNYHAGIPEAEAKRFWEIIPPIASSNVIAFQKR